MELLMEKFVEHQNIARFTTLLMIETDTASRMNSLRTFTIACRSFSAKTNSRRG